MRGLGLRARLRRASRSPRTPATRSRCSRSTAATGAWRPAATPIARRLLPAVAHAVHLREPGQARGEPGAAGRSSTTTCPTTGFASVTAVQYVAAAGRPARGRTGGLGVGLRLTHGIATRPACTWPTGGPGEPGPPPRPERVTSSTATGKPGTTVNESTQARRRWRRPRLRPRLTLTTSKGRVRRHRRERMMRGLFLAAAFLAVVISVAIVAVARGRRSCVPEQDRPRQPVVARAGSRARTCSTCRRSSSGR